MFSHDHRHGGGHGHSHDGGRCEGHEEGHGHSHSAKPSFAMPFWSPELLGEERSLANGPRASQLQAAASGDNDAAPATGDVLLPSSSQYQGVPVMPAMMQQHMQRMQMMQRAQLTPEMMQHLQATRMQMMQSGQLSHDAMQQLHATRMQMMQHLSGMPMQFPSPALAQSIMHDPAAGQAGVDAGLHHAAAAEPPLPQSPLQILMKRLGSVVIGKHPASPEARSAYSKELENELTKQAQTLLAFVSALLAQQPAAVGEADESGQTLLHHACRNGRPTVVELLLKHKADANARDRDGATPMHMAALCGDPVILQQLREYGADVRLLDDKGQSAMHYAAAGRTACTLHYLSECCGLSYSAVDRHGRSLLHAACQQSDVDSLQAAAAATVVALLLRNSRVDPQLKDVDGCNAMHYAARAPLVQACHRLAAAGSSRLAVASNSAGSTPLEIARRGSATEHYRLFRDMELWLEKPQPYYPGHRRSSPWYWHLISVPSYFVVAVLLSALFSPLSQGWMVAIGFALSCIATFTANNVVQHGEAYRMPNPTQLGAAVGYFVLSAAAYFVTIMWAVYDEHPLAALTFAATIPVSAYLYFRLCAGDPGFLTHSKRKETGDVYTMLDLVTVFERPEVWCEVCEIVRSKPSKHCTTCERCCFKMDEHCTYIMNCIGAANRRLFVWLSIIVFAQQLLFCCLAHTYYSSRPVLPESGGHGGFWSALVVDCRLHAWIVAAFAANVISLPISFRHLARTLHLLSKGYSGVFQPEPDEPESNLTVKERMLNVYSFLMRGTLTKTDFL